MKKTVLIVDDDRDLGELLAMTFSMLGNVKVDRAATGEEGIELACRNKPDLIIMDYKLPGINGWEAARKIRENAETANIPIIGYTAWASKEDIQVGIQQIGLNEILTKPVDIDVWESKLNRYLV